LGKSRPQCMYETSASNVPLGGTWGRRRIETPKRGLVGPSAVGGRSGAVRWPYTNETLYSNGRWVFSEARLLLGTGKGWAGAWLSKGARRAAPQLGGHPAAARCVPAARARARAASPRVRRAPCREADYTKGTARWAGRAAQRGAARSVGGAGADRGGVARGGHQVVSSPGAGRAGRPRRQLGFRRVFQGFGRSSGGRRVRQGLGRSSLPPRLGAFVFCRGFGRSSLPPRLGAFVA
jgi:hypothetical protein